MDATVRVVQFLLAVCKDIYDSTQQTVKIKCQPTFGEHPVLTADFLICTINHVPKLIIEIKNISIYASIHVPTEEAAQIFRDVHIVTEKKSTLPFLLTNSVISSFGVAQRIGDKISILSTLEANIMLRDDCTTIYQVLWKFLKPDD